MLANSIKKRNTTAESLESLYNLRVADEVQLILGVQLQWSKGSHGRVISLQMCQPQYVNSMLRRFGLQDPKPAITLMVESFSTGLVAKVDMSVVMVGLFQKMIVSLLYLALQTLSDILVAVLILTRFQNTPAAHCHREAKRILRYLCGTVNIGLSCFVGEIDPLSHVDSDYAGKTVDQKSMSGYLVKVGKAMVIWENKTQTAVALST